MYAESMQIPLLGSQMRVPVLMIPLAAIFAVSLVLYLAKIREGLRIRHVVLAAVLLTPVVFTGGHLHFLLNHRDFVAGGSLVTLKFWTGSMHAGGAIVAFALTAPFVLRLCRIPVGKLLDAVAPAAGIGVAIARVGCFLQGCCFGTVCYWPWCLSFPKSAYIYTFHEHLGVLPAHGLYSAPIHPLQLYFSASGLLLTVVALWLYPRKRYDGQVALVVLLLYGVSAAVLEFFRADYYPRAYWGPLPQLEWTALAITGVAAVALLVAERIHRRRAALHAGAATSQGV